jgi:hypothetical protein
MRGAAKAEIDVNDGGRRQGKKQVIVDQEISKELQSKDGPSGRSLWQGTTLSRHKTLRDTGIRASAGIIQIIHDV